MGDFLELDTVHLDIEPVLEFLGSSPGIFISIKKLNLRLTYVPVTTTEQQEIGRAHV